MGERSEILATLACLSTRRSLSLLAEWLPVEPERAVRAVGLGLLARIPHGVAKDSRQVWRVVDAHPQGPAGACLPGRGCRLEAAPVTLQVKPAAGIRNRAATLWLVVQDKTQAAPMVQVDGFPLRPGQAVPIALGGIGRMGRGGEVRAPCARQGRLPRMAWRYVLPAGRLGAGPVRIQLQDPSGGGAVVLVVALLPLPRHK